MDAAQTAHVADQVLTASTALAGLILVFIGSVVSAYDGYETPDQPAVRARYQWRGWFAFAGFAFSLLSALTALAYNWAPSPCMIDASLALLALTFVVVFLAALGAVRGIS